MKSFAGGKTLKIISLITLLSALWLCAISLAPAAARAEMPFFDLDPKDLTLRASFFTSYPASSEERKSNIKLAAKSIDLNFIDVGAEFSFNRTVGCRTERNGYKKAKIIVGGEFTEGVGGGVCQVSTTLYNAALLAGLKITEIHPHSLSVGYIAPSFDAMVNSGTADLKFVNDTHNPIIIKTYADDAVLKIEIYGEPLEIKYTRKSVVTGEIPAPAPEEIFDQNGDYPDLFVGEKRTLRGGKNGLKSEGYIVASKNGKPLFITKIRSDIYKPQRGLVVCGTTPRPAIDEISPDFPTVLSDMFRHG